MNLEHSEHEQKSDAPVSEAHTANTYEAPAIESVMTPESLEREVHYAGAQAGSGAVNL